MSGTPKRILIVKLADIGDALGALPAIRALRAALPDAELDALVSAGARLVLAHEPAIGRLFTLPKGTAFSPARLADPRALGGFARLAGQLRARRYDAVLFFHHLTTPLGAARHRAIAVASGAPIRAGLENGRGDFLTHKVEDHGFGGKPEWAYWLEIVGMFGARANTLDGAFHPAPDALAAARTIVGQIGPYVALHPGVGADGPARQWPIARMAAVGTALAADGYALVITGGRDAEAQQASETLRNLLPLPPLDLTGKCDIPTTAAVYAGAALFVGCDNGMAHLAAQVGAPTIAVFGPTNHRAWSPLGAVEFNPGALDLPADARVVVLRSAIPCSPCFYIGYSIGRRDGCPTRTCLHEIHATDVLAVAARLLHGHVQ